MRYMFHITKVAIICKYLKILIQQIITLMCALDKSQLKKVYEFHYIKKEE